jgi:hypothetical protein
MLALGAAVAHADDLSVVVDPAANLAAIRTFAFRTGRIDSPRPELNNSLFVKKLRTTIRAALVERGLTESSGPADVFVDFTVAGEDFAVGMPTPGLRGVGPQPVRFTEGTLVIDLVKPNESSPTWRGVYRDDEPTGSKLMGKLPGDAKKVIEKFPRIRR